MALGASRSAVTKEVVRYGIVPALAGGVIGLAAALVLVALAAALGPALRASRVDPAVALRAE